MKRVNISCVFFIVFLFLSEICFSQIISELHNVYGYADGGAIWFDAYSIEDKPYPLDHTAYGEAYLAPPLLPDDPIGTIITHTKAGRTEAGDLSIITSGLGTDDCPVFFGASSTYELSFNTTDVQINVSIFGNNMNWYSANDPAISYHLEGTNVNHYLSWNTVPDFDETFFYEDIVPDAVYSLRISSNIETDPSYGDSNITVTIIPEPATVFFLILGGLTLRKRKCRSFFCD